MAKYHTGIGSRDIPKNIWSKFLVFGDALAQLGWTLRSGAAWGADTAFERGCDKAGGNKEIYLQWKNFKDHTSELYYISPEATELACEIYGRDRWKRAKGSTRAFMARNMYQVTGLELNEPSEFVVCWTPDGCNHHSTRKRGRDGTGGTGQAIAYASELDIPVFNIRDTEDEIQLFNFLTEHFKNE